MSSIQNYVVFKGSLDGVIVILDENCAFETILEVFNEKLQSSRKFFQGAQTNIKFSGRKLSLEEESALMDILKNQDIFNVTFIHPFERTEEAISDAKEHWAQEELQKPNVSLLYTHYGMVRSGQSIDYKGSVLVLGDVNPGGVINADGNIIVMGTLNGRVHAGRNLKTQKAFVIATHMHPLQIKIGTVIAQSPEGERVNRKKNQLPQIAYVMHNQIYVEEIDVKTVADMVE
ncbi:MAG: septum site-determining protein MinC [Cellulosilyticaceae bacterium]